MKIGFINNEFLAMAFMGSIMFFVYLSLKIILKKVFSVKCRINLFRISILWFIVPLPVLKNYYYDFLCNNFKIINDIHIPNSINIKGSNITYYFLDGHVYLSEISIIFIVLGVIWTLVFTIKLIYGITQYKKLKAHVLKKTRVCHDESIIQFIDLLKSKYRIKRNINILFSDELEPMTIGFCKPTIIIPSIYLCDELTYILKHEIIHIKNNDYLTNIILILIRTVYWFNPLTYIMISEFNNLIEYYSDEQVVLNFSEKERIIYGNIILDVSLNRKNNILEDKYNLNTYYFPVNTFSSDAKRMKGRLLEMKNVKKHGKINYFISVGLIFVITLLSSVLVFAYQESIVEVGVEFNQIEEYRKSNITIILEDDFESDDCNLSFTEDCNELFVDEYGNNVDILNTPNQRAICKHSYVNGQIKEHLKQINGGCQIKYYIASICKNCGLIKNKEYNNTITYAKCTH